MAKVRGTSNVPLILGIVGGVLGLPSALCSGVCAAGVDAGADSGLMEFYLYGCAIVSVALIVVSCFSKKAPIPVGIIMLLLTLSGLLLFACTFNILGIISMVLTLIAALVCLTQKKETVE